jgi:Fe-S-cluster containining protein
MLTDLVQIRRLGEKKRDENERFRKHLKRHNYQEKRFRALALEVEEQIDCRACANCCRVATARITDRDVERLARFLRIKPAAFLRDYTEQTIEEGLILKRTEQGCVFLSGNDCLVYEARPANCEDFPHVVRGSGSIASRMWDFKDRACYCPIVYHTLESFKVETGFVEAGHARPLL